MTKVAGPGEPLRIPNKLYFKIGEVSEITGAQPYVLRHWEMHFPTLNPKKNGAGQRLYRREDIEMVRKIQHLLHVDGFTTAGAVRKLEEKRKQNRTRSGAPRAGSPPRAASGASASSGSPDASATPATSRPTESRGSAGSSPVLAALRRVEEALDLMKRNDARLRRLKGHGEPGAPV